MVNVYEEERIIARVNYNANLDKWNGSNWQNGGTGRHLGLTKLRDGRYVLIHGTQWQGESDYAEVITAEQAIQEILQADAVELFDKYPELKELSESTLIEEL